MKQYQKTPSCKAVFSFALKEDGFVWVTLLWCVIGGGAPSLESEV